MTNHLKSCRDALQLFRDVFAELAQSTAAIGAASVRGKMVDHFTRRPSGRGLRAGRDRRFESVGAPGGCAASTDHYHRPVQHNAPESVAGAWLPKRNLHRSPQGRLECSGRLQGLVSKRNPSQRRWHFGGQDGWAAVAAKFQAVLPTLP